MHFATEIGDLVREVAAPSTIVASTPFLNTRLSTIVPFKKDWPTIVLAQATILPSRIAAPQPMEEQGTVITAANVVLACPQSFTVRPGPRAFATWASSAAR